MGVAAFAPGINLSVPKTPAQLPFPLFINGNELSVLGPDTKTYRHRDPGFASNAELSIAVRDHNSVVAPWIGKHQPVLWIDAVADRVLFQGDVTDYTVTPTGPWQDIAITATHISECLDTGRPIIATDTGRRGPSDANMVQSLLSNYCQRGNVGASPYIKALNAAMPPSAMQQNMTLRAAIDQVLGNTGVTGAVAYMDNYGHLHTMARGDILAPYTIGDTAIGIGADSVIMNMAGLVSYWQLAPITPIDALGLANGIYTGTAVQAASLVPGSTSMTFTGSGDMEASNRLDSNSPFTVLCFSNRPTMGPSTWDRLASVHWPFSNGAWLLSWATNGSSQVGVQFATYDGTTQHQANTPFTVSAGLHLIAGAYDGSTLKVYVDGVATSTTYTAPLIAQSQLMVAGNQNSATTIQDVATFNRALTATEISAIWAARAGTNKVPADISIQQLGANDVDALFVTGGTPAATGAVYAWQCGITRPAYQPLRWATLNASSAMTRAAAVAAATVEFNNRQNNWTGTLVVTGFDGWAKGQLITISNTALGWSGVLATISALDMVIKPGGARQYTLTVGSDPTLFTARLRRMRAHWANVPINSARLVGALGGKTVG